MSVWKPLLAIFLSAAAIWFVSAWAYQIPAFIPCLPKIMGDPAGSPENIFAPVAAFFSGLSAMATAYLIYLQIRTVSDERIIAHFFELLEAHRRIVENLSCPILKGTANGQGAIHAYCEILKFSVSHYCKSSVRYWFDGSTLDYDIKRDIQNEMQGGDGAELENEENLEYDFDFKKGLEIGYKIINEKEHYCLEQYFHNIYIMIKLLHEHRKSVEVNEYLRTLRAELSQEEFLLIYYHAWMHEDHHNGEKKFKELIEKTRFFHTFRIGLCFDKDPESKKQMKLYEESAFKE